MRIECLSQLLAKLQLEPPDRNITNMVESYERVYEHLCTRLQKNLKELKKTI